MNFTILLTDRCNLICSYCYERKKEETISRKKMIDILNFIEESFEHDNNIEASINLQGGEILLEYKKMVEFINVISKKHYYKKIKYISITTNGTIYNKEISNFIRNNKIVLSISIDGNKESHNRNRLFKNGKGSYDIVYTNIKKYIDDGIDVRCRMTYTSDTVDKIFAGLHKLETIGVKMFVLAFNPFDNSWGGMHNNYLINEYYKIQDFIKNKDDLKVSLVDNVRNFCVDKGDCFSGVRSFAIDPKGDIYSCVYTIGEKEHYLGNVEEGYDNICLKGEKMQFSLFEEEKKSECKECSIRSFCDGFRCKAINKKATGDSFRPLYVTCGNHKVIFYLFKENYYGQI